MKTENWVREEVLSDYHRRAINLAKRRKEWEEAQLREGKKEVLVPHEHLPRTYIVKYI